MILKWELHELSYNFHDFPRKAFTRNMEARIYGKNNECVERIIHFVHKYNEPVQEFLKATKKQRTR